jgi:hypothetical protein
MGFVHYQLATGQKIRNVAKVRMLIKSMCGNWLAALD